MKVPELLHLGFGFGGVGIYIDWCIITSEGLIGFGVVDKTSHLSFYCLTVTVDTRLLVFRCLFCNNVCTGPENVCT